MRQLLCKDRQNFLIAEEYAEKRIKNRVEVAYFSFSNSSDAQMKGPTPLASLSLMGSLR